MIYLPVLSLGAVVLLLTIFRRGRRASNLPPGPSGLPVVGSLFQASTKLLFLKLDDWAREYGRIFSYTVMGQPIIVLNTAKEASDILDRLSTKTSDRPSMIKANDFLTRNMDFAFLPRDDRWRMMRRGAHESLNVRAATAFHSMQEEEAAIMIQGFLKHPEIDSVDHFHRVAASIGWRSLFGHQSIPLEGPDPSQRIDEMSMEMFCAMVPGGSIVDVFPALKPIISSTKFLRRQADVWYEELTSYFHQIHSANQVEGEKSLSGTLKETGQKLGLDAHDSAWLGGTLFFAAQDTTASALRFFFLAMLLYPESAAPARAELEAVVGDRPPTFGDRDELPQVEAMVKEVLRWRPPAPLSIAHAASEDFEYGGYTIPKGALIVPNVYTICRDPALYVDGERFDPSRFIDEEGRVTRPARDSKDDYLCFGHGRRICIGKDLAVNSLWITFAYLLWAFEFRRGRDAHGNEVNPGERDFFDHGATVQPMPFPIVVVPRILDLEERLKSPKAEDS